MADWLFQANPRRFLVDEFLKDKPDEFNWLATQHAEDMRVGEVVYIWRAKGGDPDYKSGVIAACTIISPASTRAEDTGSKSYWIEAEKRGDKELSRVRLRLSKASGKPRPSRSEVTAHPVLRNMSVISIPRMTNYVLRPDESGAIRTYFDA